MHVPAFAMSRYALESGMHTMRMQRLHVFALVAAAKWPSLGASAARRHVNPESTGYDGSAVKKSLGVTERPAMSSMYIYIYV